MVLFVKLQYIFFE